MPLVVAGADSVPSGADSAARARLLGAGPVIRVTLAVEHAWKLPAGRAGPDSAVVEVWTVSPSACGAHFERGARYLVFAHGGAQVRAAERAAARAEAASRGAPADSAAAATAEASDSAAHWFDRSLWTSRCSGTAPLDRARDVLARLGPGHPVLDSIGRASPR